MLTATPELIERAARAAHEVNRAYCSSLGDDSQPPWDDAAAWQQISGREGVQALVADPLRTPAQSHEGWMAHKIKDGWTFGAVKDPNARTHPCLMPYAELPPEQRTKDHLFRAAVLGVLGVPDASYEVAALEEMRAGMDVIMARASEEILATKLTVMSDPEARAAIPVHEARANLASAVSAELASIIRRISGLS